MRDNIYICSEVKFWGLGLCPSNPRSRRSRNCIFYRSRIGVRHCPFKSISLDPSYLYLYLYLNTGDYDFERTLGFMHSSSHLNTDCALIPRLARADCKKNKVMIITTWRCYHAIIVNMMFTKFKGSFFPLILYIGMKIGIQLGIKNLIFPISFPSTILILPYIAIVPCTYMKSESI